MLQIQPHYHDRTAWHGLADRFQCRFEVHELPGFLAHESPAMCSDCLGWYASCGLVSSLHGAYIDVNPFSADREIAAQSRKEILESCQLAVRLGAENIVFHCSCFPFLRGAYLEQHAEMAAEFYSLIAREYNLRVFLENSWDLDPEPLSSIMHLADPALVNCCLDIGHANYSRAPFETWFEALAERIGYLHLSDNLGQFDDHLPLGHGSVRWSDADRLYRQLGKDLPITLETKSLADTESSVMFLTEHGYFL